MIPYPHINPEIFRIGPVSVRWYGVMYVLGFISAYFLIQKQERAKEIGLVGTVAQDLLFYLAIGLIVGARLGYILFYEYNDFGTYIKNPLEIIATWHGGMSFHGGLIGSILASWVFAVRRKMPFTALIDCAVVTAPIGLMFGRIGNFINGELLGLPTDVPWAMVFPDGGPVPRHPTQLYEAFAEGLLLFLILWFLRRFRWRDGMMIVFFMIFYATFRFIIEFFKEPDPQLGYLFGITMGQVLCLAMYPAAALLAFFLYRKKPADAA